jgi:hypothetical protein
VNKKNADHYNIDYVLKLYASQPTIKSFEIWQCGRGYNALTRKRAFRH